MKKFVFITDTHFMHESNVRAGDVLHDLINKLDWVVNFANKNDAILLHAGDFFNKSTVPDEVKTAVIKSLKSLNNPCYVIWGNHDWLYVSEERNYRTSLQVLAEAGIVKPLLKEDLGEVILTSQVPLLTSDKPQILLFHGFFNRDDGKCSLYDKDIQCDSKALILLGHDHSPYDPISYRGTQILRIGSFLRAIRNDSSDRIPQCLLITVDNGDFSVENHDIEVAKPVEFIFKDKQSKIKSVPDDYDELLQQLKSASKSDDDLLEILKQVTDNEVISYISNVLQEIELEKRK